MAIPNAAHDVSDRFGFHLATAAARDVTGGGVGVTEQDVGQLVHEGFDSLGVVDVAADDH